MVACRDTYSGIYRNGKEHGKWKALDYSGLTVWGWVGGPGEYTGKVISIVRRKAPDFRTSSPLRTSDG